MSGNFNSKKNNADFRPAENVTKGYLPTGGGGCNANARTTDNAAPLPMGFPIDMSRPSATNRLGNGNWDFEAYWDMHQAIATPPPA